MIDPANADILESWNELYAQLNTTFSLVCFTYILLIYLTKSWPSWS